MLERAAGNAASGEPDDGIRFRILGPVAIRIDGVWQGIGSAKCRTALAMLLEARGRVVSVDRLIDGLWQDELPSRAPELVRNYIMKLRRIVPEGPTRIRTHPQGYQFALRADEIDAEVLRSLVRGARAALCGQEPSRARELAEEALGLRHGPVLADVCHQGLLDGLALELEEQFAAADEVRIRAMLACGQAVLVVPELRRKVADRPDDEVLSELLMNACVAAGNPTKAIVEFERIRARLADEMGVDPGDRLRRLHERIITHDLNAASTGDQRDVNLSIA
jgi:DNA-binding SARP family transcriptional activator